MHVCVYEFVWAESEEVQNNLKQWIQKSKWCIRDRSSFSRRMVNTIIFYVGCLIYVTKLHESLHLVWMYVCWKCILCTKLKDKGRKTRIRKDNHNNKYFESTFVVVNMSILSFSFLLFMFLSFLFLSTLPYDA